MRKSKWVIAACLVAVIATNRPALGQALSLGVKAGATFATISGDNIEDLAGNRTGLSVGGFANFPISSVISLQPEVLFVQKGSEVQEDGADAELSLSYLEVPLLARFSFPTTAPIHPYFFAGPTVSFKVGCSVGGSTDGVSFDVDCDQDSLQAFSVETETLDFGLIGGVGAGFGLGAGEALVDVRYNFGLSGVFDGPDVVEVKNRVLTLMLGYSIAIGG